MPEQWQLMDWGGQSIKKWSIKLRNIASAGRHRVAGTREITDSIKDEKILIDEMFEGLKMAFARADQIRKRRDCLEGKIRELEEVQGIEQDRLATALMMIDPEIAALNPSIIRDFLFLVDGKTMKKAFGPGGLLPLDRRLMMFEQLKDLKDYVTRKK